MENDFDSDPKVLELLEIELSLRCRALVTVVRRAEIILNCYNVFCVM